MDHHGIAEFGSGAIKSDVPFKLCHLPAQSVSVDITTIIGIHIYGREVWTQPTDPIGDGVGWKHKTSLGIQVESMRLPRPGHMSNCVLSFITVITVQLIESTQLRPVMLTLSLADSSSSL